MLFTVTSINVFKPPAPPPPAGWFVMQTIWERIMPRKLNEILRSRIRLQNKGYNYVEQENHAFTACDLESKCFEPRARAIVAGEIFCILTWIVGHDDAIMQENRKTWKWNLSDNAWWRNMPEMNIQGWGGGGGQSFSGLGSLICTW